MKIRAVGAELFSADGQKSARADGQTDITKLIFAFRNFANAPKKFIKNCNSQPSLLCLHLA